MSTEYITVGKLGRSRGIDGEIYVTPATDFPDRFLKLKEIFVLNESKWEKMEIVSARLITGRPVLKFRGYNNPEEVSKMTNRRLAVLKEQLVELPEDSFYIFDLVGLEVYEQTSGRLIGIVTAVEKYPANDVYIIEDAEKKKYNVAAVKDFVKTIDVENKKIMIDEAGLIES